MLERGGTRPGTSNVESIMEADETGQSLPTTPRQSIKVDNLDLIQRSEVRLRLVMRINRWREHEILTMFV